jgi:uncharacterized protein (TIGR03437 family)
MKRLRYLLSGALPALTLMVCSQAALCQTITITPAGVTDPNHPLAFNNVPLGATSQPQSITVSASVMTTIVVQPAADTAWLIFPSGPIYHPGPDGVSVPVIASAAGLGQGTYSGSFYVSVSQYTQSTVYVSMTVSGASALAAYPSSLSFTATQGALTGSPGSAAVSVTSGGFALSYVLSAQVQAGDPNWILLSAAGGVSGYSSFTVQVNPSNLPVGTHTGWISVNSTSSNDSATIYVTLVISPNSFLSVAPMSPQPLLWRVGTPDPPVQRFTVSSASGIVQFGARLSPPVAWAALSAFSGSAGPYSPATLSVTPTPNSAFLRPGTYVTNLIVTPLGGADLPAIPFQLIATASPYLGLSTTSLSYLAQFGAMQAPPDQLVTVTASDGSVTGFSFFSDSPWLTATASSTVTPSALNVHVNPAGLPVGTVSGNLTIVPTNGEYYAETISVTLTVVSSSQLSVGPSQLLFSYQTNVLPPAAQSVQVRSSGTPVSFSVSTVTASCGSNWLTAVPSSYTTPATLTVGVSTLGFVSGLCQGAVTLTYNSGSGPSSAVVYVTAAVSDTSELVVAMPAGFGDEAAQQGAASYTRLITLTSTDSRFPVNYSAFAYTQNGGTWLNVTGFSVGSTPQTLSVQVTPSAAPGPGLYSGTLVISSFSLPNGFVSIPITLRVSPSVTVSASPTSLLFNQTQGGPAPGAKLLTLTSSGGSVTFAAGIAQISGGNWLSVSPTLGQANGYLQVSILPNALPAGDYPAQILLTFQNAATGSLTIYVTLRVSPAPRTVSVSPSSLSFTYQKGGLQPLPQKISVTSTGGAVDFTIGVTSSGWLSADVIGGTTPKDVTVSVNPAGLAVLGGAYTGSITVSAPGVLATAITLSVSLVVAGPAPPTILTIASNASGAFGAIAPGEMITIKGISLASATQVFSVNAQGNVDSTLAGVRVLFSNVPGTPIYVSPSQVNVIAPFEIEGTTRTNVVVENQGVSSVATPVSVADFAPGLFTIDFTGSGQVAAVNENGTLNGPAGGGYSPGTQGGILTVYATGFGQTSPHSITGSVTPIPDRPTDLIRVTGTVTANIAGQAAEVVFAGAAPGLVAGVVQLNLKLPLGMTGNQLPIVVSVNGKSTPLVGTTVAVQ